MSEGKLNAAKNSLSSSEMGWHMKAPNGGKHTKRCKKIHKADNSAGRQNNAVKIGSWKQYADMSAVQE